MQQTRLHKYQRDPGRLPNREITDRSLAIIALIERYRFLPTSLLLHLAPGGMRGIYQHLQTLYHLGYINHFAFPRMINLSESYHYLDNPASLNLLIDQPGVDPTTLDYDQVRNNREKQYYALNDPARSDEMQGTLLFLKHEVMISRFHAMLELACRATNGAIQLVDWRQGKQLFHWVTLPKVQAAKSPIIGEDGKPTDTYFQLDERERLSHEPDALFGLYFRDRPEDNTIYFEYEAQRTKKTSTARFIRKLRATFQHTVKQKLHRTNYDINRIRAVLIETPDRAYADTLRQAAAHPLVSGRPRLFKSKPYPQYIPAPSPLFWVTASDLFTKLIPVKVGTNVKSIPLFLLEPEIIFSKIWAPPNEDTLYSLLD